MQYIFALYILKLTSPSLQAGHSFGSSGSSLESTQSFLPKIPANNFDYLKINNDTVVSECFVTITLPPVINALSGMTLELKT